MANQVKFSDAERVDLPDMTALAAEPLEHQQAVGSNFLISPAQALGPIEPAQPTGLGQARGYVVTGFKPEVNGLASAKQFKVQRGVAVLGLQDGGQISYGALATEGPAVQNLDLTGYAVAVWAAWIRFDITSDTPQNRILWDAGGPSEFTDLVDTRKSASWSVKLTRYVSAGVLVSPGPEWTWIGDVDVQAGQIVVTDKRSLFFEGKFLTGSWKPQWGWNAGVDRSANRDVTGLKDLRSFAQAMLAKVWEIQGDTNWWDAPAEPLAEKLTRNGGNAVGSYHFSDTGGNTFLVDSLITASKLLTAQAGITFQGTLTGNGSNPKMNLTASGGSDTPGLHVQNVADDKGFDLSHFMASDVTALASSGPILLEPLGSNGANAPMSLTSSTQINPVVDNAVKLGIGGGSPKRWSELNAVVVGSAVYEAPVPATGATHKGHWRPQQSGGSGDPALWNLGVTGYPWATVFAENVEFQRTGLINGIPKLNTELLFDNANGWLRGTGDNGIFIKTKNGASSGQVMRISQEGADSNRPWMTFAADSLGSGGGSAPTHAIVSSGTVSCNAGAFFVDGLLKVEVAGVGVFVIPMLTLAHVSG